VSVNQPSILIDKASEWFELGRFSESMKYMLFTCPAKEDKEDLIPAVLHADKTARVQLVHPAMNPRYFKLIEAFYSGFQNYGLRSAPSKALASKDQLWSITLKSAI
jgi:predicted NodU family carbamoyl transferase